MKTHNSAKASVAGRTIYETNAQDYISVPILGADFLCRFVLVMDLHNKCLIDSLTSLRSSGKVSTSRHVFTHFFKNIAAWLLSILTLSELSMMLTPPIFFRITPLTPQKLTIAPKEFEGLLKQIICRPSGSCWFSPLHIVPEPNGEWRPCCNYGRLTTQTIPDR